MPTYATADDCVDYIDGLTIDDAAAFDKLIERAERQVDRHLAGTPGPPAGLRVVPSELDEDWQRRALARAVCAQVEYRLDAGDELQVRDQHDRVKGPDYETQGRLSRIGPKVADELEPLGAVGLLAGGMRWAQVGVGPRPRRRSPVARRLV